MWSMKELHTQSAVIDALGGNEAVAYLCSTPEKPCTAKVVSNWRRNGFPARTYLVVQAALLKIGCMAPVSLWNMIPVHQAEKNE